MPNRVDRIKKEDGSERDIESSLFVCVSVLNRQWRDRERHVLTGKSLMSSLVVVFR